MQFIIRYVKSYSGQEPEKHQFVLQYQKKAALKNVKCIEELHISHILEK